MSLLQEKPLTSSETLKSNVNSHAHYLNEEFHSGCSYKKIFEWEGMGRKRGRKEQEGKESEKKEKKKK
jgi:hypothetical protein